MICYECRQAGKTREPVALCHHCSAALCLEHALMLTDPVTAQYPVFKTVVLPLRARVFLCSTCHEAFRQTAAKYHGEIGPPGGHIEVSQQDPVDA